MEKDLTSSVSPAVALNVQAITTDTTTNGNIIDTQGYESIDISAFTGAYTDGTYTLKIEDGDDSSLSDAADVSSTLLIGSLPALSAANSIGHVGVVTKKRYVRASLVSTSTSSGATLGVVAVRGHAASRPTV